MNMGCPGEGSGFTYKVFSHSFTNCEEKEGEILLIVRKYE